MNTVLFVCVENTFRSVLSEELFNSRAPPGWRAESAGVSHAEALNPAVKGLLAEVGVALTERKPRMITPQLVAQASRVVTFGCLDRCPIGAEGKGEDWQVPGAAGRTPDQLREVRDDLSHRVDELIQRYCVPSSGPHEEMPDAGSPNLPGPGLEGLREELVRAARSRGTLTYGELMKLLGVSRGKPLFEAIVAVDRMEYSRGAPGFAAIIVRKDTGYPGGGFFCDDGLPETLRRPYSRASDPRLSAQEMNYVKEEQRKIWAYYSDGSSAANTLD